VTIAGANGIPSFDITTMKHAAEIIDKSLIEEDSAFVDVKLG
jgi:hypothetical protein